MSKHRLFTLNRNKKYCKLTVIFYFYLWNLNQILSKSKVHLIKTKLTKHNILIKQKNTIVTCQNLDFCYFSLILGPRKPHLLALETEQQITAVSLNSLLSKHSRSQHSKRWEMFVFCRERTIYFGHINTFAAMHCNESEKITHDFHFFSWQG